MRQSLFKMLLLAVCIFALPAFADAGPVQMTVQSTTKRRGTSLASRELKITVTNTSAQPLTGLMLRWAVVKTNMSSSRPYREVAFGAEQALELKPLESRIIESGLVEAPGHKSYYRHGDQIDGHGAQVLRDGKIVAEVYSADRLKRAFEKLRPLNWRPD